MTTLEVVDATTWIAGAVGVGVGALATRIILARRRPDPSLSAVPHRARVLLGSLAFPLVIARSDGAVEYANTSAHDWGLALSTRLVPPTVRELITRAITQGITVDEEMHLARGVAREPVTVLAVARPIPGEDRAVVTGHDLEGPMGAEVARREFVVNVSHELKTPIGALRLLAESLGKAAKNPTKVREFSHRMTVEVDRLAHLVQQIIELSRVQSAETIITPARLSARSVVDAAIEAVQETAKSQNVTVSVKEGPDVVVAGDASLLRMAVRNLVENAILYSPKGAVVTIEVTQDREEASISVIDRGIGIASHEQFRVFERFYRADNARARDTGGSGLGLAIVKHIARQHGGTIDLWSEIGVGSTFSLRLPLARKR